VKISRLLSQKDKRAAAALLAASAPWITLGIGRKHCLSSLNAPFRETFCLKQRGAIAGLVTITMYGTFKGYIQTLFVAREFRGQGIGEELLAFAEKRIFRATPNVLLCVSSFNKGAQRFYRRLGYKKTGVLKDFVVKGSDEILMRKTTGPLLGAKRKP